MSYVVLIGIVLVILALCVGAWIWYTNTPTYKAAQAKKAATDAALASTQTSPVGLQQGVNSVLEAGEAQRRLGASVDPGLDALRLVKNAYLNVAPKWNELRSTDVSDPARRVNIMANLTGMIEANIQLFVRAIPYISTQEGLDYAKQFFIELTTDSDDRRNCWWGRENGCWRNWSTAEPHEDTRVDEEQARLRDMAQRILAPLAARARTLHGTLFTQPELALLHNQIHGDPARQNDYAETTFTDIQGWLR